MRGRLTIFQEEIRSRARDRRYANSLDSIRMNSPILYSY
jgi:hypothetical protein